MGFLMTDSFANPKRECVIFCLESHLHIDEYSKMIDWAYQNPNGKTVLIINEVQVYEYQQQGLWDIIAKETDNGLFGLYEDDWIFDFDIMSAIIQGLKNSDFKDDKIVLKIIEILTYAITYQKSVVFYL